MDLTILQVSGGMFQLKASQMLLNCGGRLFDRAIADHLVTEFERLVFVILYLIVWKKIIQFRKTCTFLIKIVNRSIDTPYVKC